jgi:putative copper export protein
MEVPIPNFYFMGIQFIHLLALSIWVGGIVAIGFIVAPTLFRRIKSRRTAGELMGEILRKFDLLSLFCIAALIITGMIKYWTWENLTPWNLTRYLAILVMSGGGLYSALVVSPKLRDWMTAQSSAKVAALSREAAFRPSMALAGSAVVQSVEEIETGEGSPPDFNRLHHLSVRLMVINLICGVVALLMA